MDSRTPALPYSTEGRGGISCHYSTYPDSDTLSSGQIDSRRSACLEAPTCAFDRDESEDERTESSLMTVVTVICVEILRGTSALTYWLGAASFHSDGSVQ